MTHYYLDSSALVKRYASEAGTAWVMTLCAPTTGHTINTVRITGAEIIAALFRRVQTGSLKLPDAQMAATRFRHDLANYYEVIEVTESLVDTAMRLAETYAVRGYDSVQLAAALTVHSIRTTFALSPLVFVCADKRLNNVAAAEGLIVEDPNDHP